ncbi:pentapeptide repeat-containing protein [Bradyrhizobium lablabi]|uniref:pentapeptide repeat-containing protein n=1 Tax=Bradyrhizobium lablabi TaxID=722472 RepID=UPI001BADF3BD|nr:pentapeptide repeat-containing protein [Bradyrhizobium lablabi]MBR1123703.1 pentapeptide repeat-containing protein [Bradyrhizobium lablabi]
MADQKQVEILSSGVDKWNIWREQNPAIVEPDLNQEAPYLNLCESLLMSSRSKIDLKGSARAKLSGANLFRAQMQWTAFYRADFTNATFAGGDLSDATIVKSDLSGANLNGVNLTNANLQGSRFASADLSGAILRGCDLTEADLSNADLRSADLRGAKLVRTNLSNADLTRCRIYGAATWGLNVKGAKQRSIVITDDGGPEITVDDIEIGQFLYLMIDNIQLRRVIDGITSKLVLILGRFTPKRKSVLDSLRDRIADLGYIAVVFDFEKPENRSTDETVALLGRMAKFIIADLSDAKSVLQELRGLVPDLPNIPVQPIIVSSQFEPGMFDFYKHYPWMLPVSRYAKPRDIINGLESKVIAPVEAFLAQRGTAHNARR